MHIVGWGVTDRAYRVPGFRSGRHTLFLGPRGSHTRLRERGDPIRTTGQKACISVFSVVWRVGTPPPPTSIPLPPLPVAGV
jgi:hypothetical protein